MTSQSLANFLDEEVPLQSGKTAGAALQIPETLPGWRSPNDFYVEMKMTDEHPPQHGLPNNIGSMRARVSPDGSPRSGGGRPAKTKPIPRTAGEQRVMKEVSSAKLSTSRTIHRRMVAIENAQGRVSLETEMGLSIIGETIERIVVQPNGKTQLIADKRAAYIKCFGNDSLQLLIKLTSGNWLATACFPRLIGTILVERGSAMSASYYPSDSGAIQIEKDARSIRAVLARWMALSQHGIAPSQQELKRFADEVRNRKHANPSLGILAAYAYERAGNLSELKSLSGYYARVHQAVPFDVAYLPSLPIKRLKSHLTVNTVLNGVRSHAQVAGYFPLMTQGWAYLDQHDRFLNRKLFEIRKGLIGNALWTTLRDTEGQELATLLERGAL